jgi:uncharacterized protein (DUF1697 family)
MDAQIMTQWIALLRGINVGGHRKVPMADLRELCSGLGWGNIRSYIQSGNLLFTGKNEPVLLGQTLQEAIKVHFGFEVPVILRTADQWDALCESNPFPEESEKEPNLIAACFSHNGFPKSAVAEIEARGAQSERAQVVADTLWIHYPGGQGRSKITPVVLDRLAGSPVTARNWRTLMKIRDMAG